MRAVVQRVSHASVTVDGREVGRCGPGFVVLVAAGKGDTELEARKMADRVWGMRVLPDETGKMNLALKDVPETGEPNVLAVSNFTVYGDATQRRPSFTAAAPYDEGERLFDAFVAELHRLGARVETGVFGAEMALTLTNTGPVTLVVET